MNTITLSVYEGLRCTFEDYIENDEVITQLVKCIDDNCLDLTDMDEDDKFVLDYLSMSYAQKYCNYEFDYNETEISELNIYFTIILDDLYQIVGEFDTLLEVFNNLFVRHI